MLIHPGFKFGPHPRLSFFSGDLKNSANLLRAERWHLYMRHSELAPRITSKNPFVVQAFTNRLSRVISYSGKWCESGGRHETKCERRMNSPTLIGHEWYLVYTRKSMW